MFGETNNTVFEQSPLSGGDAVHLSLVDRRLILAANLRLLSHRLRHNIPVIHDDLLHMLPYADDASSGARGAA
jgi:hypothetical protein